MALRPVTSLRSAEGAASGQRGIEQVLREVESLAQGLCRSCGKRLCHHDAVLSVAMGLSPAPRCFTCFSRSIGRELDEVVVDLRARIARKPCQAAAWAEATRRCTSCAAAERG